MAQIKEIDRLSKDSPVLIFKHSTRCPISSMALRRLKEPWNRAAAEIIVYYLDLLANRPLSDALAQHYAVEHQSPQVLLLQEEKCIFHTSHNSISQKIIEEQLLV